MIPDKSEKILLLMDYTIKSEDIRAWLKEHLEQQQIPQIYRFYRVSPPTIQPLKRTEEAEEMHEIKIEFLGKKHVGASQSMQLLSWLIVLDFSTF